MRIWLRPLFTLGQVVVTSGAAAALATANEDLEWLLEQYKHGDWGSLPEEDQFNNAHACELGGGRILGRYVLKTGVIIWVTTEPDRSVTTVLLPEDW